MITKRMSIEESITLIEAIMESITAATGKDLEIQAASGKDILIELPDNAGARKVKFIDSDSAEVGSIDSNGAIIASKVTAPIPYATSDTNGAPGATAIVAAFGAAASGKIGVYKDSHSDGKTYLCISDASGWKVVEGTAAA